MAKEGYLKLDGTVCAVCGKELVGNVSRPDIPVWMVCSEHHKMRESKDEYVFLVVIDQQKSLYNEDLLEVEDPCDMYRTGEVLALRGFTFRAYMFTYHKTEVDPDKFIFHVDQEFADRLKSLVNRRGKNLEDEKPMIISI